MALLHLPNTSLSFGQLVGLYLVVFWLGMGACRLDEHTIEVHSAVPVQGKLTQEALWASRQENQEAGRKTNRGLD